MANPGMGNLIKIVNGLHDVFSQMGTHVQLQLPQIAVVGGQSAGKSSVLENFVGKDFLPRGAGIVTRRPLILQLKTNETEYCKFQHTEKIFKSFEEVRDEIEEETARLTGSNKGISRTPINLSVYSPHVLDLTLIDLPGLTKVPIGDQPPDIEKQIREMILEYIQKENSLILAVSPANNDIANSDALKLAQEVDPQGHRTIGVITKLDLMDAGTDALDVLENKVYPLRRGYVGVVNRSQKSIVDGKEIRDAMREEKEFFSRHPRYKHICDRMGTPYLQRVLNKQLNEHIRDKLPGFRKALHKRKMELESQLAQLHHLQPNLKMKALVEMTHNVLTDFETAVEGICADVNLNELSGGARLKKLFMETFPSIIRSEECDEKELRAQIEMAIRNINGCRVGLFTPNLAFEAVVKKLMTNLEEPSLQCVDLVKKETTEVLEACTSKMKRYPHLHTEIDRILFDLTEEQEKTSKQHIKTILECELSYVIPDGKRESVVHKGLLKLKDDNNELISGMFVLTTENLTSYEVKDGKDMMVTLPLDKLKTAYSSGQDYFVLVHLNGTDEIKNVEEMILYCSKKYEVNTWLESFEKVGVYSRDDKTLMEPYLARQVSQVYNMVVSYMPDVTKTLSNLVTKTTMKMIVINTKTFIAKELLANLLDVGDVNVLLEESAEEKSQREHLTEEYKACKEGLRILASVRKATLDEPNATLGGSNATLDGPNASGDGHKINGDKPKGNGDGLIANVGGAQGCVKKGPGLPSF